MSNSSECPYCQEKIHCSPYFIDQKIFCPKCGKLIFEVRINKQQILQRKFNKLIKYMIEKYNDKILRTLESFSEELNLLIDDDPGNIAQIFLENITSILYTSNHTDNEILLKLDQLDKLIMRLNPPRFFKIF